MRIVAGLSLLQHAAEPRRRGHHDVIATRLQVSQPISTAVVRRRLRPKIGLAQSHIGVRAKEIHRCIRHGLVPLILNHTEHASVAPQPEHYIFGVHSCSDHHRADVCAVLLEALSPETGRLPVQYILPRLRNGKRECPIIPGQQLLLCRLKVVSLTEPHIRSRQRMPIHRIHNFAGYMKFRRNALRTEMRTGNHQQRESENKFSSHTYYCPAEVSPTLTTALS